ncbi:ABC transporter ATP-binding protein [Sporosarcina sp. Marseille-Q4943]|uniref:ABC transporter ATP-binding protein n=1 Tax=Sporosarcina sp. Marseille-Q4943 TaxID=2942204 RepID=UPI00208DDADD|nr:sn-glycerol-3-phosphate ABC transporter ATP-binding protein UgpC [Sporosarcina sp. Marseille-Q4943]
MAELILEHIYKEFDKNVIAVSDFHLHIKDEEFIVFVGPSGCGKSTTLRMIAGLEEITSGNIYINGERVNDVAPKDRDIAMVFQNYALYPHMTVYGNMAFGLKNRKFPKAEIHERVMNAAKILGLEDLLDRKPKALSGGQRQRVALGRAIVRDAQVFLMDEPLSNLDAKLRVQMRAEIAMLHQRLKTTTIYVTHDQTEAMTMATRLVVMKDGFIQQIGSPKEVYEHPENMFVGGFIGSPAMNFFTGIVHEGTFRIGDTKLLIPDNQMGMLRDLGYSGKEAVIGIRPEHIEEAAGNGSGTRSNVSVRVDVSELTGAETMVYSSLEEQKFVARLSAETAVRHGELVNLAFVMDKVHFFDKDTELRIRLAEEPEGVAEIS